MVKSFSQCRDSTALCAISSALAPPAPQSGLVDFVRIACWTSLNGKNIVARLAAAAPASRS
jgi:hypothetical protein